MTIPLLTQPTTQTFDLARTAKSPGPHGPGLSTRRHRLRRAVGPEIAVPFGEAVGVCHALSGQSRCRRASRRFALRHATAAPIDLTLDDGDLLVMSGPMQREWKHGVPKMARVTEPRVNLTFRWVEARR